MSLVEIWDAVVVEANRLNTGAGHCLENIVAIRFGSGVELIEKDGAAENDYGTPVVNAIALACYRSMKDCELKSGKIFPLQKCRASERYVEHYQLERNELRSSYDAQHDLAEISTELVPSKSYSIDGFHVAELDVASTDEVLQRSSSMVASISPSHDSLGGITIRRAYDFALPPLYEINDVAERSHSPLLAGVCDQLCKKPPRKLSRREVRITFK